jgi:CRP-like cAMP-binding protein
VKAFVIGWPIEHSKSPPMINAAFRAMGIAAVMERKAIRPEELSVLRDLQPLGVSVTIPHKEAIVALLGPDEFVGEGCLIGQLKRLATASAMTECEIMRVEKTEIQRVLRDEPAFSQMFVSHVLARNARVEEDLVDQLFNSTEKRLARLLLMLANFGKDAKTEPILAKISQETLAEMIGTTRSRVSHFMNKFRELGFIDYNGHLEVHTSLLGVLLADQPRTVNPPE